MTSLRKLALTSTMAVLMLVTLFPTYVKADVQLTSEFENPVKNWNFKDRDMPDPYVPNNGVYECPPWQTNKPIGTSGGWQELRGDVNGDRLGDIVDMVIIGLAMGSQPGDDNWNEIADIDGSGLVDMVDLVTAAIDFGKETKRIDGSYSWYTSGGGDYQMWQWLDSDVIQSVAGQKVMFSFCFYPESLNPGQEFSPDEGHHWYPPLLVKTLTYTPPSGKSVHVNEVGFDTYITGGTGRYIIEFHRGDDWKNPVVIANDAFTNTVYETKKHTCDLWGNPGESVSVKFFVGWEEFATNVYYKDFYMNYDLPALARAEIYYEYSGGSNTVYGTWIAPTELNWWNAYVTVDLPSTTTTVKVIVYGKPDFKAWIDSASFSIYNYEMKEETFYDPWDKELGKGTLALGVNVYEWHIIGGSPQPNGKVFLLPTLYAESTDEIKINRIELKVELLPNDGSSTTQDGFIDIRYCAQENNEGHDIEPANPEEAQARMLETAAQLITIGTSIIIGIGIGVITSGTGIPLYLKVLASTSLSTTVGATVKYTLRQFASEPVDEHAQMGTDYFVRELWQYPDLLCGAVDDGPFVEAASGQYILDWAFNTNSIGPFQIKVTATAKWGLSSWLCGSCCGPFLPIIGSTSLSSIITISP